MNSKQKLFLIFHGRFPSEKAASIMAAKSAESFTDQGFKVTLLVPRRLGREKISAAEYYSLEENFKIVYLPTLDLYKFPLINALAFYISFLVFSLAVLFYLIRKASQDDIIYSNESFTLLLASLAFKNIYYEIHDFPEKKSGYYKLLIKKVKGLIVTNQWKVNELKKKYNLADEKVFYEPNAVEISDFDIDLSKSEARQELGLPQEKKIIVYTGHLYKWKGVDVLAKAAEKLSPDHLVYFVGGTEGDIKNFKDKYRNINQIKIVGFKPHAEIPVWQKAADVLVLPNTAKEAISTHYTSPMKLFEYMCADRPIIASNIPSIGELLNEDNSILCEADNSLELAKKIDLALADTEKSAKLAHQARQDIENHSWHKRAGRIIEFISNE